ncbi:hypothetical protein PHYSODRAFT_325170 [Phytophthora sojae]|uniref:PWWP domain-containing protein n=1 Tax=Phytophthora sojae (strain P6497) TaxID=1094619 RepID=G4Z116_PHYSP|nr:hypothetical protein PHYSODRAFT_325170 [Phytophthora sojae]EGZ24017.1 hypothetical protein PHYSODRAFT_325170 [Phytophthora sojae]|eukprot:XP_009519305.1 hypothetical protein PHYSODRAFT_325170 [Phytophthora sojae]
MAPKRKTLKRAAADDEPAPARSAVLSEGDWLDVMDLDGVWSVARVLSVPSAGEVAITYDGWPSDYNEVVRVDSDRVAPYHTYTWAVKCWVKYLNWPIWPSVVTIRSPGTEAGIKNLSRENRLDVDFVDDANFAKRGRVWQTKGQVKPFADKYDENRTGSNGNQFERALEFVLQSSASDEMPKFVGRGTLPLQYKKTIADPVAKLRKSMGDDAWFGKFADSKARHWETHMYDVVGIEEAEEGLAKQESAEESSASDEPVKEVKPKPKRTKQSALPKKKRTKVSTAKRQMKAPFMGERRLLYVKK